MKLAIWLVLLLSMGSVYAVDQYPTGNIFFRDLWGIGGALWVNGTAFVQDGYSVLDARNITSLGSNYYNVSEINARDAAQNATIAAKNDLVNFTNSPGYLKNSTLPPFGYGSSNVTPQASSVCPYGIANYSIGVSSSTVTCAAAQGGGASNLTLSDVVTAVGNWSLDKPSYQPQAYHNQGTNTSSNVVFANMAFTPASNCSVGYHMIGTAGSTSWCGLTPVYTNMTGTDVNTIVGNWSLDKPNYMPKAGGTFTGTINVSGNVSATNYTATCIIFTSGAKIGSCG